jgi:lipid A 3-O-deacylase
MRLSFLAAATFFATASLSHAAEHLTVGAGAFNVFDNATAQFSGEYRGEYLWQGLRPMLGVSVDLKGGAYGYGGVNYDLTLGDSWVLTPNFAVGAYHEGGSKDLGHTLNFRSGLELDYKLADDAHLGATFNHISNAGLGNKNPGAESLMLVYSHPISLWGK